MNLGSHKVATYKSTSVNNFCIRALCRLQTGFTLIKTKRHLLAYFKVLK